MTGHYPLGRSARDFEDPAFEPRSSFDFEEEVADFANNMSTFNGFPGDNMDFGFMDAMYEDEEEYDQQNFPGRTGFMGPSPAMQDSPMSNAPSATSPPDMHRTYGNVGFGIHPGVPEPRSALSNIIDSRNGSVTHNFGQITPPDDLESHPFNLPSSKQPRAQQSRTQESGKLTNEQRARNAANTRHSRTKNAKKKSDQKDEASDGEDSQRQGKDINVQREKNRVAAAKCRAKKKSANEKQEDLASKYGATNDYLTRQIRELKNQKTEFQNLLLAHRPGVCECHGVHEYNFGQAQKLVFNARRQVEEQTPSPSLESVFSAQSPMSDGSSAGMFPGLDGGAAVDGRANLSRHQSFQGPSDYTFNQASSPRATNKQQNPQGFADFLRNSPSGRAGFA